MIPECVFSLLLRFFVMILTKRALCSFLLPHFLSSPFLQCLLYCFSFCHPHLSPLMLKGEPFLWLTTVHFCRKREKEEEEKHALDHYVCTCLVEEHKKTLGVGERMH